MKILIVDDEQDICEILQYNLETEGYDVDTANSAEEALSLTLEGYDLLLLDVMMGEMSGFQLARRLKENAATANVPIIFITALDGEDNTAKGLNIGADDYIAKPLFMKEVKARVKAVLRRTSNSNRMQPSHPSTPSERIVYKGIVLDENAKTVTVDGEQVPFTKLEYEILSLFLSKPNKVLSRNDVLKHCWPKDVFVSDRTVDVNITRLRKKLGAYGDNIKTRIGYGYYFEE